MQRIYRYYDAHGIRGNPSMLQYLIGRPVGSFSTYMKRIAAG
jgi:hypothetical protein